MAEKKKKVITVAEAGRRGGKRRLETMTATQRKMSARRAAQIRWATARRIAAEEKQPA